MSSPGLKVIGNICSVLCWAAGPYLPSVLVEGNNPHVGNIPGGVSPGLAGFIMASELTPIVQASPLYPQTARYRRIEGYVLIEFTVTREGRVEDATIIDAKPTDIFDRATLRATLSWRFQPHVQNGQTIAVRARQQLDFKLTR